MRDLGLFVAKKRGSGVDDAWEEKSEVVTMWVEILFICHDSLDELCLTRVDNCCNGYIVGTASPSAELPSFFHPSELFKGADNHQSCHQSVITSA